MQSLPSFEELRQNVLARTIKTQPPKTSTVNAIKAISSKKKLKVAAYCRVSTAHEDQQSSLNIQRQHFASLLAAHSEWENAGLYVDVGSGTKKENRSELQRLLNDCKEGKVSLIITKSLSRFSRSTADTLQMVRQLSEMGIGLIFEKENIDTRKMESEFLLSILASLAENESRGNASNCRWGIQKRFKDGSYKAAVAPYGYDLVDGNYEVNPFEAEVVRAIYDDFLRGDTYYSIAKKLNEKGVLTKRAGQLWHGRGRITGKWNGFGIRNILSNEAYCGTMILQKTTKDDSFTSQKNEGQLPMYRIIDHHPAIIDYEIYDKTQLLMEDKTRLLIEDKNAVKAPKAAYFVHPFTRKLVCGECGRKLQRTVYRSGNAYWHCGRHLKDAASCPQNGVSEKDMEIVFKSILLDLHNEDKPLRDYLGTISSTNAVAKDKLEKRLSEIDRSLQRLGNAETADEISRRNQLNQEKLDITSTFFQLKSEDAEKTERLIRSISDGLSDFEKEGFLENFFTKLVREVIVFRRGHYRFCFYGGFTKDYVAE